MSGVTKEEVIHFHRAVLKRVFNARLVDGAIADVVEQMNWPQLEELGNGPPVMRSTEKQAGGGGDGGKGGKKRKKGAEGGEGGKESGGKAKPPHALSAYTLFITLAMDMIAQDPDNPAFKVPEKLDESGQPIKGRGAGGKMTAASGLWSSLSEQQKAAFQQVFKPLTDSFNKETQETGSKVKDVSSRVKEFKQTLPAPAQQELNRIFEHAMASNPRSSYHTPSSPSPNNHQQQQQAPAAEEVQEDASSDESEEEEEDEEEPSQQQQLKEQEERRLQQEAKEKKKEGKEGKDGKKEKKKEGKVKEGKKGEEGSTKKKKKTVVSDDST
ncbi:hypothetical protein DUNSADRAFT_6879 [Dunaliella salina]|uniref:Uncharacterized protein n=1 Tax=Dunaliella salina TaxID=3046 RepID=A0ABQ7GMF5_DUNSA|nr:hypothetical protein DUNSADRAFT_6879 [Dunaliella salina]|eukprot:KAF5835790.1 hypothetical protein DUNSADRAFT_6879 [Dunaliella salina]